LRSLAPRVCGKIAAMAERDRFGEFEARLAALKYKMETGLAERARALRAMAARVEAGDASARKELKTESHKLRGIAGSYGHHDLTELAAQLEQRASVSPPAAVGKLARDLADLAERKAHDSEPPAAPPPEDAPRSSRPPARSSDRPAPQPGTARLRVLAMDDDPVTQRLLLLTLQQVGGFDATIVHSAERALELLRTEHYDVVVSDAMMPDMNGREFRRAAREAGATMPIVILSAASPAELGWAGELGKTDAWLRKPFKPTELVQDILRIAGRTGTR
jgi:CheY-like chemotaxis protein